ncbi:cytochrome c oxidase assembly protein COX15 homolog [Agrilus planipennis]|uniref:Cytochrome c oxidase assembly protein COX15 homolog n=1 Tax=Agrilus planipennis TaxID=224129 RepID=A0A1W4X7F6_AGRPL|nr:cytochrome c oxidase assembly protein COX15 homolog [Agrilus planipennis]
MSCALKFLCFKNILPIRHIQSAKFLHSQRYITNNIRRLFPQKVPIKTIFIRNIKRQNSIKTELACEKTISKSKAVGYWLLGCSGMVIGAVILGGVTRLTESGLSMVTWKFLGEKIPKSDEEWIVEFEKYKQYPEFKYKNHTITLGEFKWIWYMEFAHRMWGRTLGLVFLMPAIYFWSKGAFNKTMKIRVPIFGCLIAAQGLLGWYMVKSGLEDRFQGENDVPKVSHYRLASHLTLAFILYSLFLWSALDHLLPAQTLTNISQQSLKTAGTFRMLAHSCKGFVFLTAVSGAFVAGLDAGLVYNSFPKMGDKWIPEEVLALKPKASNFTENPVTVQLEHRLLGTTTLCLISGLWLMSRRLILPPRAYAAVNTLAIMVWFQVTLGITSLLTYVPVPVAASHQSGSLALLSFAVWLTHELKRLPKAL